jgi:transcriptional regulator with XRE-family HTH domain
MSVGDRVKSMRLARGWTLRELASLSGLSAGYLSQLETGKRRRPSSEAAVALSRAFDVSADSLISETSGFVQESIAAFALEEGLNPSDISWLAHVRVGGRGISDRSQLRRVYRAVVDELDERP